MTLTYLTFKEPDGRIKAVSGTPDFDCTTYGVTEQEAIEKLVEAAKVWRKSQRPN